MPYPLHQKISLALMTLCPFPPYGHSSSSSAGVPPAKLWGIKPLQNTNSLAVMLKPPARKVVNWERHNVFLCHLSNSVDLGPTVGSCCKWEKKQIGLVTLDQYPPSEVRDAAEEQKSREFWLVATSAWVLVAVWKEIDWKCCPKIAQNQLSANESWSHSSVSSPKLLCLCSAMQSLAATNCLKWMRGHGHQQLDSTEDSFHQLTTCAGVVPLTRYPHLPHSFQTTFYSTWTFTAKLHQVGQFHLKRLFKSSAVLSHSPNTEVRKYLNVDFKLWQGFMLYFLSKYFSVYAKLHEGGGSASPTQTPRLPP